MKTSDISFDWNLLPPHAKCITRNFGDDCDASYVNVWSEVPPILETLDKPGGWQWYYPMSGEWFFKGVLPVEVMNLANWECERGEYLRRFEKTDTLTIWDRVLPWVNFITAESFATPQRLESIEVWGNKPTLAEAKHFDGTPFKIFNYNGGGMGTLPIEWLQLQNSKCLERYTILTRAEWLELVNKNTVQ
jgi:hypothetical protein